jgi:hypothetical protein
VHTSSILTSSSAENTEVAVKKFGRPFETVLDAKRTFRELRILRLLSTDGRSRDIIRIIDMYTPQTTLEVWGLWIYLCV